MKTEILTVEALSKYIKLKFDSDQFLKNIRVKAEIADINVRRGIYYLKLKDAHAVISAVIFSDYVTEAISQFKMGDEIEVYGDVNAFIKNGTYQFYIREADLFGVGAFYRAFQKTQKKLHAEGLFDAIHKKELPKYPQTIGLITASNSAALQDMLVTLAKRYPLIRPVFYPTTMQGVNALKEITAQLQKADAANLDVLVLARGGGSYEDLVVFNDEQLARTIFALQTPIITGIGHEIDTTIADFVADLRAATPSAAIEHAVPDKRQIKEVLLQKRGQMDYLVKQQLMLHANRVNTLAEQIRKFAPTTMLQKERQALQFLVTRFTSLQLHQKYFVQKLQELEALQQNLVSKTGERLVEVRQRLEQQQALLEVLGPIQVLTRGYAYVQKETEVVSKVTQLQSQDKIDVHLIDGIVTCTVEEIETYEQES